jgi:hypothetical protein
VRRPWAERAVRLDQPLVDAMRPFSTGAAYLNFTPEDRVRDAFGAEKYARLVALKDRYDPDNLFRMNQNIKPSRVSGEPGARVIGERAGE